MLPPRTCDLCGLTAEKFYPVFSGGDILTVCGDCKGDVAGGE
jgi:ribosome-binding protein aMBF1 (putative translation factor)